MADINKLKDTIKRTIYPNGKGAINASDHQAMLLDMADGMAETDTKLTELESELGKVVIGKGWVSSSLVISDYDNAEHGVIAVNEGQSFSLINTSGLTEFYAFLSSYTKPSGNGVTLDGLARVSITDKAEGVVPPGAKYLLISISYDGVSRTPSKITIGGYDYTKALLNNYLEFKEETLSNFTIVDSNLRTLRDEATELVRSVNIFNKDTSHYGYSISSSDGSLVGAPSFCASDYILVSPATFYTFKGRWTVAWYDNYKTFISSSPSSDESVLTLKSPANARYMRFSFDTENYLIDMMHINEGSKLKPYDEYYAYVQGKGLGQVTEVHDSTNLFNTEDLLENTGISSSTGALVTPFDGYSTSGFIVVTPNKNYTFKDRWVVVWFDDNKEYISASSSADYATKTLRSPANASFMRFSFESASHDKNTMQVNEGDVLLEYEPYGHKTSIKREALPYIKEVKFGLDYSTIKLPGEGLSTPKNLCLIAVKNISNFGNTPNYCGYLFLEMTSQKLYYSKGNIDNPSYICDWNTTLSQGVSCENYCAIITNDGDIVFLRDYLNNGGRSNPIVYPHENYDTPYIVDFGESKKPYGFLMGSSVVCFNDGSFCFGDYVYHSLEAEQNNDGRCIWKVSKPYNDKNNWLIAHQFKHVYFESPISDEPDNEIGHIHAITYDWYKGVTYCTTGDIDRHCRLWYSLDRGTTWNAVPNAVGALSGNEQGVGQKWRFTNMLFTPKYIYWCTDSFYENHALWRAERTNYGVIKVSSLEKIIDLEVDMPSGMSQATYASALLREPNGILIIDRAEPRTDGKLDVKFYSFEDNKLYVIHTFDKATTDASSLDQSNRVGLPNQITMQYQAEDDTCIMMGGGRVIRPNNTSEFNNSLTNYVGALRFKVVVK